MDKQTWQIILGMKVGFLLVGLLSTLFNPPYSDDESYSGYMDIFRMGFVGPGFLLLIAGFVSVLYNLWARYRHGDHWESLYQPGPEHTLIAIYLVLIPLVYFVGSWILILGYTLSIAIILFIIGAHLGEELIQKNKDSG